VERLVTEFRAEPLLLWCGVLWAVVQGLNLYWYYQGTEAARLAVSIDLTVKAAGVVATFVWVRSPADAWKVLAVQGFVSLTSFAILLCVAYRSLPWRRPRFAQVWDVLRPSATNFMPRNASTIYTMGNAFILGLFAPPQIVGVYAGADRISRAIIGLLGPASDA